MHFRCCGYGDFNADDGTARRRLAGMDGSRTTGLTPVRPYRTAHTTYAPPVKTVNAGEGELPTTGPTPPLPTLGRFEDVL